jgi:hypothetical protein
MGIADRSPNLEGAKYSVLFTNRPKSSTPSTAASLSAWHTRVVSSGMAPFFAVAGYPHGAAWPRSEPGGRGQSAATFGDPIEAPTCVDISDKISCLCADGEPARSHGIADADMQHAVRNAISRVEMDDDLIMMIGPSGSGTLLEVGVLGYGGDDPVIIHAMTLRQTFFRFLP